VEVSPRDKSGKQWLLIETISGLPPITDLSQPELRLAGLRMNPRTNGPSRGRYFTSLRLQALPDGAEKTVAGVPNNPRIRFTGWSPDARHLYFVNASDDPGNAGLSLWLVDVATAQAKQIPGVALNGIFGAPCEWMGDSQSLVCKAVVKSRGAPPQLTEVPVGPVVQENLGRATPGATYEDMIKNPEDEAVFDYYATSQIEVVGLDGSRKAVGKAGVIQGASPSPDGHWVMIDERHHPYSYLLPFYFFPERVTVVKLDTGLSKQLNDKALQDAIPNIHDAVAAGPRDFNWRSDAPAQAFWVEAGDGGDSRKDVAIRDTLFLQDAPFDGQVHKLAELPLRFRSITWGNDKLALVEQARWKDRKRVMLAVAPDAPASPLTLFDGSLEDRYHDPGRPLRVMNGKGKRVLETTSDGSGIYLQAEGASPEGDKPFLAVMSGERRKQESLAVRG